MGPLRLILALGVLLVAAFALAWNDALPAGAALEALLVDDAARAEQTRRVHRATRLAEFASLGERDVDVLFIGADVAERAGAAQLGFIGLEVAHRGIAGEPLALLAERLEPTVRETTPSLVVVEAAAADARRPTEADDPGGPPTRWRDPEALAREVARMLDDTLGAAPDARALLLEVLPRAEPDPITDERVRALNAALRGVAATRPRVDLVRTWHEPVVDVEAGALRSAFLRGDGALADEAIDAIGRWLRAHAWVAEATVAARQRTSRGR